VEKAHGRIEKRVVQTSTVLNDYVDFPHVHQVFRIERSVTMVKSEKRRHEVVFGVTSCSPERANPARIGELARGQWGIVMSSIEVSTRLVSHRDWAWGGSHCLIAGWVSPATAGTPQTSSVGSGVELFSGALAAA
jgi:hypothetical protein